MTSCPYANVFGLTMNSLLNRNDIHITNSVLTLLIMQSILESELEKLHSRVSYHSRNEVYSFVHCT